MAEDASHFDYSRFYMQRLARAAGLGASARRYMDQQMIKTPFSLHSSRFSSSSSSSSFPLTGMGSQPLNPVLNSVLRGKVGSVKKPRKRSRQSLSENKAEAIVKSPVRSSKKKKAGVMGMLRRQSGRSVASKRLPERKRNIKNDSGKSSGSSMAEVQHNSGTVRKRKTKKISRKKVIDIIRSSMKTSPGTIEKELEASLYKEFHLRGKAETIEGDVNLEEMVDLDIEYAKRGRKLVQHLRQSQDSRDAIAKGTLSLVDAIYGRFPISEKLKKQRDKAKDKWSKQVCLKTEKGQRLKGYSCPQCRSTECFEVMLFQRRDIGKGETWGSKDGGSEARSIITCQKCGHEEQNTT